MKEVSATVPQHLMVDEKAPPTKVKNALGKDDFMKLLMAQLTHQDPLNPMDHKEFSGQLAQFGSLEQLQNIQKGIEGLQGGVGDEAKLSALSMIGKKIQTVGNEVQLVQGQAVSLKYQAKDGITPVKAAIYGDNGGKLIREISIDGRKENAEIVWDGKDTEGKDMPPGQYTFRVQGIDKKGQSSEMGTELSGRVTGVDMEGKDTMLLVQTPGGNTRVNMAKVRNVTVDDESAKATTQKVAPERKDDKIKSTPSQPPVDLETLAKAVEVESESDDPFASGVEDRLWHGGTQSHFDSLFRE